MSDRSQIIHHIVVLNIIIMIRNYPRRVSGGFLIFGPKLILSNEGFKICLFILQSCQEGLKTWTITAQAHLITVVPTFTRARPKVQ